MAQSTNRCARQRRQRGQDKIKSRQRYQRNKTKYKRRSKQRHKKLRNNPTFKRKQKLRRKNPSRFKRLAGGTTICCVCVGRNLDIGDVYDISPEGMVTYQHGEERRKLPLEEFLVTTAFPTEEDLEAFYDAADDVFGVPDDELAKRVAQRYLEERG